MWSKWHQKSKKNYKRAYFFPLRPKLSAGLAEKLCQELTTLPLPAGSLCSAWGTADTACLVVPCIVSDRKLFPQRREDCSHRNIKWKNTFGVITQNSVTLVLCFQQLYSTHCWTFPKSCLCLLQTEMSIADSARSVRRADLAAFIMTTRLHDNT